VDLDDDGWLDVVAAGYTGDVVTSFNNDGRGGFGPGVVIGTPNGPREVHAADVDGDGDLDLLSPNIGDGTLAWLESKAGLV
jgi:hypothetical protein